MTLAWGQKVSATFRDKVVRICGRLGIPDPSWLMAVMWFESKLKASARNPQSGATGLIQFMPNGSIKELGTTPQALAGMTEEEQLDYVERYFVERGYAGRMKTLADVYMAVFWPAAIGKPDNATLITDSASAAYVQNKGLDVDKDGQITKAEAAAYVVRALAEGLRQENVATSEVRPPAATQSTPNQGEGKRMGALGAGLIGQLLQTVVGAFAPAARAKVEQAAAKVTGDEAGAQTLADGLMSVLQKVTGIADPIQATAAVTAPTPAAAAILAKVEQATMLKLDELAPFMDRIASYEAQAVKETEDSRTSARAFDSPEGWKLRWAQVTFTQKALAYAAFIVAILIAVMSVALIWIPGDARSAVLNLIGQLVIVLVTTVGLLGATLRDQNGFSFGGTVDSNAAALGRSEVEFRRTQGGKS